MFYIAAINVKMCYFFYILCQRPVPGSKFMKERKKSRNSEKRKKEKQKRIDGR